MGVIEQLSGLLAAGKDSALLRFGLGNACHQAGRTDEALVHLAEAVRQDPQYSAAWKAYGKVLVEAARYVEAMQAYRDGIAVALQRGDLQAAKEMQVFLRRVEKMAADSTP